LLKFALFIVFVAIIISFGYEISERAKGAWASLAFKNIAFLFLASLFAHNYQLELNHLLTYIFIGWRDCVAWVVHFFPSFDGVEDVATLFFLFGFTYVFAMFTSGLYRLIRRKQYANQLSIVWFVWVVFINILLLA
jgi:hypothetical protein